MGDIVEERTAGAMKGKFMRAIKTVDLLSLPVSGMLVLGLLYVSLPLMAFSGLDIGITKEHASKLTAQSVLYSVIGIICFMWGAFGRGKMFDCGGGASSIVFSDWNNQPRVLFVCVTLFIAGFGSKVVHVITGDYLLHRYLGPMSGPFAIKYIISLNLLHTLALAVACCFYYRLKKVNDPAACFWKKIAMGLLTFEVACALLTRGSRFAIVIPVAIALLARHYLFQRNNRLVLIVGLVVMAVLFPVKNFLRNPAEPINNYFTANHGHSGLIVPYKDMDGLDVLYYGLDEFLGREGESNQARAMAPMTGAIMSFAADSSMGRLAQAHVFALIVMNTNVSNYLYGRGFLHIFTHFGASRDFIERISGVKPEEELMNKYGLVGLNKDGLPTVSVPSTIMGDLYLNFGLAGIVGGMFLVGVFVRRVYGFLAKDATPPSVFVYAMLWIFVLHGFEQSVATVIAQSIKEALVATIVCAAMVVPLRKLSVLRVVREGVRPRRVIYVR